MHCVTFCQSGIPLYKFCLRRCRSAQFAVFYRCFFTKNFNNGQLESATLGLFFLSHKRLVTFVAKNRPTVCFVWTPLRTLLGSGLTNSVLLLYLSFTLFSAERLADQLRWNSTQLSRFVLQIRERLVWQPCSISLYELPPGVVCRIIVIL